VRAALAPGLPGGKPEGPLLEDRGLSEAALPATRLRAGQVLLGILFLALAAVASVLAGPADLPPLRVLEELVARLPFLHVHPGLGATGSVVVWQLRMPRTVLGGLVGAMLATAGASYQGVFSNPLADPYLLGVASGAGLGATIAVAYAGWSSGSGWPGTLPVAAFSGAVVAVAATFALGRSRDLGRSPGALVLAGVAVAAFFTAVQTFLLERQSPGDLTVVYTWILGSLSTAGWSQVELVLPYIGLAAAVLFAFRRVLDVLSVGDEEATALGVRANRARLAIVAAATLGTAAAVSVSGLIGFVGIIVPHTVRLLAGPSYRRIIPLSLLFGAGFLILADLLARTALSPEELPLGVVTAFLGAPFFLVVLRQAKRMA
jgi:iron complex transport system permease protein